MMELRVGMDQEIICLKPRNSRDASARRNPNTDREREWRRGFEQFEPKTTKPSRKKGMTRILTEKSGQPPSKYGDCKQWLMSMVDMLSFKIHDYPCHTCMDANAKRANRKPVSDRDTCDVQFDLFDMSK
jgi:hypothetical protein